MAEAWVVVSARGGCCCCDVMSGLPLPHTRFAFFGWDEWRGVCGHGCQIRVPLGGWNNHQETNQGMGTD